MNYIPDLARSCKTDHDLRPRCIDIRPRRKGAAKVFDWTVALVWDLSDHQVMNVTLPAQLRKMTGDMKAAYAENGVLLKYSRNPSAQIECDLVLHVGATYLPAVIKAAAIAKSVSLTVSPGNCRVKWVLDVSAPRDVAPSFLDLLDCDVSVEVRTSNALPFPEPKDEDEDEDEGEEEEEGDSDDDGPVPKELGEVEEPVVEDGPPVVDIEPPARKRRASVIVSGANADPNPLPDER